MGAIPMPMHDILLSTPRAVRLHLQKLAELIIREKRAIHGPAHDGLLRIRPLAPLSSTFLPVYSLQASKRLTR